MKIVIHGTKGGYHIFTPERIPGFIDARPDYNKVAAIGQEAYAINFNSNNVVLSKYRIIRDVPGEKRMGNVAFSVIIPNNKMLSGADAKALLDQLSTEYCSKYIVGDNLDNVREDWNFVELLTREYERRLEQVAQEDIEEMQQGTGEAAFVYYDTELEKYLAEPYQQEYKKYKQIFFVKSDLKDQAENPLNALRHNPSANLTGQIDLRNPKYTIIYNEYAKEGVKIEVYANGLKCKNKDRIRKKSDLEISYTKQYYLERKITSKWNEVDTEYVDVNDAAQTITIRDTVLSPRTKTINIEVKEGKKKTINDADITCENHHTKDKKVIINNEVSFKAEELKENWTVCGKKNNLEGQKDFIPENQYGPVTLVLEESKIVTFLVKVDNDKPVNNYKVKVQGKSTSPNDTQIKFIGDEMEKLWDITISYNEYESKFFYRPDKGENPKNVCLQKQQPSNGGGKKEKEKHYIVSAGQHGKLKAGNDYTSTTSDGHDVVDRIVPKFGYEFLKFDRIGDTLIAKYKKIPIYKNPILVAIIVVSSIVLFSAYKYDLLNLSPKDKSEEIISYCDGNDLFPNELEGYQKSYCSEGKPDYCKKIKNALEIRTAINEGNIDQLKNKDYSISQDSLKKTIHSVNEKFKEKIGITLQMYPASELNLLQVADVITKLQKLLLINVNGLRSERDCDDRLQLINGWGLREDLAIVKSIKEQIDAKKKTFTPKDEDNIVYTNPTPDPTPNTHKSDPPIRTQPGSGKSAFELKFWAFVNQGIEKKETYDKLLNNYNSKKAAPADISILNYLRTICKDSESFLKFKGIPQGDRITATKLSDISID